MPARRSKKRANARKASAHAPDNAGVAKAVADVTRTELPVGEDLLGSEELKRALGEVKRKRAS